MAVWWLETVGDGMVRSSSEISREICQIQNAENRSLRIAMRNLAKRFQALRPTTGPDTGTKPRSSVRFAAAAGRSQSLRISDDRREPNPSRAKEGRKVESNGKNHEKSIERTLTGKSAHWGYPYRRDTEHRSLGSSLGLDQSNVGDTSRR
jgi:hypothetical protein